MDKVKLFSLGEIKLSDFVEPNSTFSGYSASLELELESSGAARLTAHAAADKMYGKYWYRSGINDTMNYELKDIVKSALASVKTKKGDLWLDIACNDGTLLKHVPKGMLKMGVDPADDSYYNESKQRADEIIQDFFSKKAFRGSKFGDKKAKIITIIAMFYDLDDPESFLKDVHEVIEDDGLLVIQMSYTPLMLKQLAFDNICHEHIYYHNLTSMKYYLEKSGFNIVDCELNDVNGGSFRLYIRKSNADKTEYRSAPYRDVANYRVNSILAMERHEKMTTIEPYMDFWREINKLKTQTVDFIKDQKKQGKSIWAYGASTKGNTLLQWFGLDKEIIDGIAERSPYKFGLETIGTRIPIFSEEEARRRKPDYMLVLPWHFIDEFVKRERVYLRGGGKFILPCPTFQIIEK